MNAFAFRDLTASIAYLWFFNGLFPLTPALSLRERERHRSDSPQFDALRLFDRQVSILPLPEGEGWGEGEETVSLSDAATFLRDHRPQLLTHNSQRSLCSAKV